MKMVIVITTILGLIAFFVFDVPTFLNKITYSVHLTPSLIKTDNTEFSQVVLASITNNNPYPIYSVRLKVSENRIGSHLDEIQIEPEEYNLPTKFSPETNLNGFVVSSIRKDGKKEKHSIIYKIDANSKIDIKITIPPTESIEVFKLKIEGFSKEAEAFFEGESSTFFNIRL